MLKYLSYMISERNDNLLDFSYFDNDQEMITF